MSSELHCTSWLLQQLGRSGVQCQAETMLLLCVWFWC